MSRLLLIVAFVFTCACRGEQGPQGQAGEVGPAGPKGDPGAPGRDGRDGVSKVPHLVVAATGEDLGVLTTGSCVWDTALAAELCYGGQATGLAYWLTTDCSGDMYARSPSPERAFNYAVIGDVLYEVHGGTVYQRFRSYRAANGTGPCTTETVSDSGRILRPTGKARANYAPVELVVDLR